MVASSCELFAIIQQTRLLNLEALREVPGIATPYEVTLDFEPIFEPKPGYSVARSVASMATNKQGKMVSASLPRASSC